MDLVSGYSVRASCNFSSRMSTAVCSKEAAKSAICSGDKRGASSWEGKEMGRFKDSWTALKTAVFRPEKEKSREGEWIDGEVGVWRTDIGLEVW